MAPASYFIYMTSVGPVTVVCEEEAVVGLYYGCRPPQGAQERETILSASCCKQLTEYLAGERKEFDLPLRMNGTPFQKAVWNALRTIPYGQTRSYADIAVQIGNAKACRAVGMANNRNPISIVVPCHRVVGKDGSLTGYAGGVDIKECLLELEKWVVKK